MTERYWRHRVYWGIVVLLSAMLLSACDLGPVPTPTSPPPTAPPPTILPTIPPLTLTAVPTAKPQPTKTAVPTPVPTATATPVPTRPPAPTRVTYKYPAPKLLKPNNGDGYGGQLLWEPLDLAANEYYHISVHSVHNKAPRHWGFDTEPGKREGKFLLPRDQFGDKDNNWKTLSDTGEFTWEVQVMRAGVPISPPSATWSFFWYRSSD